MPILEVGGQTAPPGASWESRSERIKLIGPRADVRGQRRESWLQGPASAGPITATLCPIVPPLAGPGGTFTQQLDLRRAKHTQNKCAFRKGAPIEGELSRACFPREALLWTHHAGGGYAEPCDGLEAERDSSFPPMSD